MIKQSVIYITAFVQLSFFAIALHQALHQDWTGVFVSVQAILMSLLPYLLRHFLGIYTPFSLRVGIVFFMCGTLILGEIADFYNMFWWWDLILHGLATVGITLISFITLLIFFREKDLRSTAFLTTALAMGLALSAAMLWEIYEFIIDFFFETDTPMQPSNIDTMTDLMVSVVGALVVGVAGYRYLRWRGDGIIARVIDRGAIRNKKIFSKTN